MQKLFCLLPGGMRLNAVLSRLSGGHNPREDLLGRQGTYFIHHCRSLKEIGFEISGRQCLEIGTGWDLNVPLMMSLAGAKGITTIDVSKHLQFGHTRKPLPYFSELVPLLSDVCESSQEEMLRQVDLWHRADSLEELCRIAGIRYLSPVSQDYHELPDKSFDLIYSTAVLEHIYSAKVAQFLSSSFRVLNYGGISSHVIDLKDHFAYFQRGLPYNHFLKFSEKQWQFWAGNPMTYTNRISPREWRRYFEQAGFDILLWKEMRESQMKPLPKTQIHPENSHWSNEELAIGEIRVITRRP